MSIDNCKMCDGCGEVHTADHGEVPCPDCIAVGVAEEREGYETTIKQLRTELEKERGRVRQLESVLTPEVVDLVRCGIGGNYGGSCYDGAMAKHHAPLVAALSAGEGGDNEDQ